MRVTHKAVESTTLISRSALIARRQKASPLAEADDHIDAGEYMARAFPLLTDTAIQRGLLLNDFSAVYDVIDLLGRPHTDDYFSHVIVEFARRNRESYIKSNDILDRVDAEQADFQKAFMRHLTTRIEAQLGSRNDTDWTHQIKRIDHHLLDLWSDCVRREMLKRVRYADRVWSPSIMCIEITQQCNAVCGHCASNSSPKTKIRLAPEQVRDIVTHAAAEGIKFLGLTGGEPFLEQATLLEAIRTATENGILFDYINSNCFWAKTFDKAVEMLEKIKTVAHPVHIKQHRGMFSLSVTTEHLKWVPLENFKNVILAHEQVFPGQTIELVSVRGSMFGDAQAPVFDQLISLLGDHVTHVERGPEGWVSRIRTKKSEIDVFHNYIVPIGRGEDMKYEEYEHYELSDKELQRGLSLLAVDGKRVQTMTVGWDGKCAPDVVLKCSESVIAGNLYLKSFKEVVASGNNDPLIRGILESVYRIINISKRMGIQELMLEKLSYHNSIQGYVSEFMKDPKKRLLMTIELLKEDLESNADVRNDVGIPIDSIEQVLDTIVPPENAYLFDVVHYLIKNFYFQFNFSGTKTQSRLAVIQDKSSCGS